MKLINKCWKTRSENCCDRSEIIFVYILYRNQYVLLRKTIIARHARVFQTILYIISSSLCNSTRKITSKYWVVGSEPNISAKEMWLTWYRKNKPINSEFLFCRNPIVFYSTSNKLASVAPSGLKCGTHIFYKRKLYFEGHIGIDAWIVPFPSL